ncbi:hypothetical protein SCAB_65121 [Streptomyces scabiei 87.22]|uniref:Uncharacterized protein n=1 Tax=Streptomyces scabiei (strain 87.22) TaxID=680198 RepID=C9ZFM5_STRSW|nr:MULTISPECIES: hypothetical protein [Streptomyces]MBP5931927.1 hypothetical protein [Streptomyces sp. LBUM 1479]MDX2551313.1 hypothetical protein [Streptomyces stelliscabiei]MDX3051123.1 hypothetical protein [Streptomyces scabiei]MDX3078683.1 hypothetical protein [Streptomyces scabiei]MDX3174382.1 hypothetical protein [Streptomyces scabiei]
MAQYRVRYSVLPAGVGPDDYEPADLDGGELVLELSDPAPEHEGGMEYGPHVKEVERAVAAAVPLKAGDQPIIRSWDLA